LKSESFTLRKFIVDEMKRRGMSNRQFAVLIGVSNATINRAVDEKNPTEPTLDFLLKLSKATNVGVFALIGMAYPDLVDFNQPSPAALVMAQKIEKLPSHLQEAIAAIIRGSSEAS
jgi:transcriptional regulator with XRE-family HTH domain